MHSPELYALEISVLLFIVHVLAQSTLAGGEFGQPYLLGARDEQRQVNGLTARRAERALKNFVENYGAFIAADLALIATGQTGGWGAAIWIVARIIYLPIYLSGVPVARTLCWVASIVGLLMMLARLAGL
jgi:uncharacterized MAPEG superfamily protein